MASQTIVAVTESGRPRQPWDFANTILRRQNQHPISLGQEATGAEKALRLSGQSHVADLLQGWLRASCPVVLAEKSFESTHISKAPPPGKKRSPRPME